LVSLVGGRGERPRRPRRDSSGGRRDHSPVTIDTGGIDPTPVAVENEDGPYHDYHDPIKGYVGKMVGEVRAKCKKPGCQRPVLIRQIVPVVPDPAAG